MKRLAVWLSLAPWVLLACRVSSEAKMQADLDGNAEAEGSAQTSLNARESGSGQRERFDPPSSDVALANEPAPLLGARRDFTITAGEGAKLCQCARAMLGPPTMAELRWESAPPRTRPETQLFFAFTPDEASCGAAPKGSRGASYWGYRIDGDDVVVLLEEWKDKPPRTLGAVIPKPPGNGQVFLGPAFPGEPYGAPVGEKGTRCALGNPGPKRQTPFMPNELGSE